MSDELKSALRIIKGAIEADKTPAMYLHDPDTLEPYGVVISPDLADALLPESVWEQHSHREGTEDDDELCMAVHPAGHVCQLEPKHEGGHRCGWVSWQ